MRVKKTLKYSAYLITLALVAFVAFRYQSIQDWWYLRNYQPATAISNLATEARFNDKGRDIFYLSDPELLDKTSFAKYCTFSEYDIVVGCYDGKKVFVLDVTSKKLERVEAVTSAHEMLHAAYSRLSKGYRDELAVLLTTAEKEITDEGVLNTLKLYKKASPVDYFNELHSVLGTEVSNIGTKLEEHYSRYFSNRQALVKIANEYSEIFSTLEKKAQSLSKRLNALATELNAENRQLSVLYSNLQTTRQSLQSRINSGESSYDLEQDIDEFDAQVSDYNSRVNIYRQRIKTYNQLKASYDAVALRHEELVRNIDYHYNPVELEE